MVGIIHWIEAPAIIDAEAIIDIGIMEFIGSKIDDRGVWSVGPQVVTADKRIEYIDVSPTASMDREIINIL